MASRKDSKGRVLKTGESQRKDGIYQYRYTDIRGIRRCIYNSDLAKLREEETKITKSLLNGINYVEGNISVIDLVERYAQLKSPSVRRNTQLVYGKVIKKLGNYDFGFRMIRTVKASDIKGWFKQLHEEGMKRSSISQIRGVLRPAFEEAVQSDILHKNPATFKLDFVGEASEPRLALSPDETKRFLDFVANDKYAKPYLDIYLILLGTGMRIGELCGLTLRDVDMAQRRITVDHQLIRKKGGGTYINSPKTKSGTRIIPMTEEVFKSFQNVLANRPKLKIEPMVDGYSGFLFVSGQGAIMINTYVSKAIWSAIRRYNKRFKDKLPSFSPHNLRHTFCTNMLDAGVDVKAVQYLMGHSKASITLDVYAHSSYKKAELALLEASKNLPSFFASTTPLLHQNAADL